MRQQGAVALVFCTRSFGASSRGCAAVSARSGTRIDSALPGSSSFISVESDPVADSVADPVAASGYVARGRAASRSIRMVVAALGGWIERGVACQRMRRFLQGTRGHPGVVLRMQGALHDEPALASWRPPAG